MGILQAGVLLPLQLNQPSGIFHWGNRLFQLRPENMLHYQNRCRRLLVIVRVLCDPISSGPLLQMNNRNSILIIFHLFWYANNHGQPL